MSQEQENLDLGDEEDDDKDSEDEQEEEGEEDNEEDNEEDEPDASDPEPEPIEWLAASRSKRAGAGNRYQSLLAVELEKATEDGATEDDLALLFEEDEQDIDFDSAVEAASDVEDGSSSDEEDKGPVVTGEDELEGEAALQKEERAKRRVAKRKADMAFAKPTATRKRVKILENASRSTASTQNDLDRPRKKSERVSWIPNKADAPVRVSSRPLAVRSREKTIKSMQENEERRMRQLAVMEAAQKRKDVEKVKPLTQAERLAEAAMTERLNSKSLNKWEETERDRADKQRARLEALQNRKLEGPVIRWYSGVAEWVGDELVHVGRRAKIEVVKDANEESELQTEDIEATTMPLLMIEPADEAHTSHDETLATTSEHPIAGPPKQIDTVGPLSSAGFLDGIQDYAFLQEGLESAPKPELKAQPPNNDISMTEPEQSNTSTPAAASAIEKPPKNEPTPETQTQTPVSPTDPPQQPPLDPTAQPCPKSPPPTTTHTPAPTPTPPTTYSTRNLLHLLNFDATAISEKDTQRRLLFALGPPSSNPSSHQTVQRKSINHVVSAYNPAKPIQPTCPITNQPAKYLDPKTGVPFAGVEAFRAIRRCVEGGEGGVWSGLLGAWVGGGGVRAAKGVPEGFGGGKRKGMKGEGVVGE